MIFLTFFLLLVAVPSWGFDAAVTRVAMNTVTGLQTITFADFSEDCTAVPCAAIFLVTRATTDNTLAEDAMISLGFTDGTDQRMTLVHDNDNVATTDSTREVRGDRVIETMEAAGIDGEAIFYSWMTNGLRIDVTDAPPAAFLLTVAIMGGAGFSAKSGVLSSNAAIDGTTDVNTVGFTPDAVLLMGTRLATNSSATYLFTTGVAVNDGSSSQGSIGCYSQNGVTTTNPHATTSTLYAASFTDNAGLATTIQVGAWDAQGFTTTTKRVGVAANYPYLALDFPSLDFAVSDIDTRTTIGATTTTVGFQPLWGMLLGTLARAYDVDEADLDAGQCMISMWAGQGQYVNNANVQDAVTTTNTGSRSDDQGVFMGTDAGTCAADSCARGFVILEPTGYSLDYSSVDTAAARKWIGFAIEDTVGPTARRRGPGLLQ